MLKLKSFRLVTIAIIVFSYGYSVYIKITGITKNRTNTLSKPIAPPKKPLPT